MGNEEEIEALKNRVKIGNDKLFKAWLQIREIVNGEEQSRQDDKWFQARDKLNNLCLELQAKGYEDCLFTEDGKKNRLCPTEAVKYWCWVCPSKIGYWRNEQAEKDIKELWDGLGRDKNENQDHNPSRAKKQSTP